LAVKFLSFTDHYCSIILYSEKRLFKSLIDPQRKVPILDFDISSFKSKYMEIRPQGENEGLNNDVVTRPILAELAISSMLEKLLIKHESGDIYRAADPGYPGNFSRDSILAAYLGGDLEALHSQVFYSAANQGKKQDAWTGEEPGKIHHELPAVEFNGASTAFNACDTTALFISSIATLHNEGDETIMADLSNEIRAGISYIKRHTVDGIFYEDPRLAGADRFGLRVTYWKDSILNTRLKEEPLYPVVYTLAHFQNADALAKIAIALRDVELEYYATNMFQQGIEKLWLNDHFVTAIDAEGIIDAPSTDSLYCLLHISPFLLPEDYAELIQEYSRQLETKAGYRVGLPVAANRDNYHTDYIWTHEQALIHSAAAKYNLTHVQDVSQKVVEFFDTAGGIFPELITIDGQPAGNMRQLWSVRAYQYFMDPSISLF
jgi:glycogen debranching enzyme